MTHRRGTFDLRFSLLVALQVAILGAVTYFAFRGSDQTSGLRQPEHDREVATKLHASGITQEAARYYERYLQNGSVENSRKAKIAYSLGELYESNDQLEEALAWYYQVELFDSRSEQKSAASQKIVSLLERMRKFSAAKRALADQTELDESPDSPKGAVEVARVGNKKVFLHQVNDALDTLPAGLRKNLSSKEAKQGFLKKYVADELLFEKALRLKLDEEQDVRKQLQTLRKQLLVQRVIEKEVRSKVTVDPTDVQNYFEANRKKYDQKPQAKVSVISLKSKKKAHELLKQLEEGQAFEKLAKAHSEDAETKGNGGIISQSVIANQPLRNYPPLVTAEIFKTQPGRWTRPILANGYYAIFKVRERSKEKPAEFAKIRSQVEFDYRMEKSQQLYEQLIEETIATNDVKIFSERMQ